MKPEVEVRRLVHGLGYRFRLHRKDLPGKPDLVFPRLHKVILVHGCFWHQLHHPEPLCKDARLPKSNTAYWLPKLERNRDRDAENLNQLENLGWKSLIVWQCEVESKDRDKLLNNLHGFLSDD